MIRWLRYNAVSALGVGLQAAVLNLLVGCGAGYLWATAASVETTILHNFLWHSRWTWRDRASGWWSLGRFHLVNGAVSLGGNLLLMRLLVGEAGLHPALANLAAIAGCGLVNFLLADRIVFFTTKTPTHQENPVL